jgi:hypothetical protein
VVTIAPAIRLPVIYQAPLGSDGVGSLLTACERPCAARAAYAGRDVHRQRTGQVVFATSILNLRGCRR